MTRLFIVAMALVLFAQQAVAQKSVTIKGAVKGDTKGYNKIFVVGSGIKNDSVSIADGKFEFKIPFDHPISPFFYTEYERKIKKNVNPLVVCIQEPGIIELKDVDIEKGLPSGTLSGMMSAEQFQTYSKTKSGGPKLEQFIDLHPGSYVSVYLLNENRAFMKEPEIKALYRKLDEKMRKTREGKLIAEHITILNANLIGNTVQDFTLNDPQDKPFSFSSLKGKYVLIDIWASWCGPCKASFPRMKEIYQKYNGENFEIYSISVDQSKENWLLELKKLGLPWQQTLDTKNIAKSQFAVTAIPTTYLVDPNGKILIKELGFDPDKPGITEQKLKEVFPDSQAR
jgi:thiol-disulfide isomerase/thioredoxin